MALKKFNSVAGFSVGDTQIAVIDANANVTALNVTATGDVSAAQVLVTGSGNITGANVVIATTVLADNIGNAVSVLRGDGANITGIPTSNTIVDLFSNGSYTGNFVTTGGNITTATGNITAGTGNVSGGNIFTTGNVDSLAVNTVTLLATTIGNAASTLFGDGGNIANIQGANVQGTVASATVAASANAVAGANVSGEVAFAAVANSVAGVNVSGEVASANVAYVASFATTANSVAGVNVSGVVANANYAAFSGQVVESTQANITSVGTLTSLLVSGNIETQANIITTNILGSASGVTITAGGTNQNVTLVPSGSGGISASSTRIIALANPVNPQDAATKQYVDDTAQGLSVRGASQLATTVDLVAIYDNGAAGVGATLTLNTGPATIDGVTLVQGIGQRVLVKNQTTLSENGIYVVTSQNVGVQTVLTRAADFDTPADMTGGAYTFVQAGTVNNNTGYVQIDTVTTVGVSDIVFDQFSGTGTFTAGTGLNLVGTQFNISNTAVTAGTYGNASQVVTFAVNAQGQLTSVTEQAVVANAETLTGTSLNATVVGSSLTSVGTLTALTVSGNATAGNLTTTGLVSGGNVSATVEVSGQQLTATNLVVVKQSAIQSNSVSTTSTSQTTLFVGTPGKSYELLIKGNKPAGGAESVSKVLATTQGDYIVYGQAQSGVTPGAIDVTASGNIVTVRVTASSADETNWICQAYAV